MRVCETGVYSGDRYCILFHFLREESVCSMWPNVVKEWVSCETADDHEETEEAPLCNCGVVNMQDKKATHTVL